MNTFDAKQVQEQVNRYHTGLLSSHLVPVSWGQSSTDKATLIETIIMYFIVWTLIKSWAKCDSLGSRMSHKQLDGGEMYSSKNNPHTDHASCLWTEAKIKNARLKMFVLMCDL